jgi:hypothetical protein
LYGEMFLACGSRFTGEASLSLGFPHDGNFIKIGVRNREFLAAPLGADEEGAGEAIGDSRRAVKGSGVEREPTEVMVVRAAGAC